jgi:hypothetical protein
MHAASLRSHTSNITCDRFGCDGVLRKRLRFSTADTLWHAATGARQGCLRQTINRDKLRINAVLDEAADLQKMEKQLGIGVPGPKTTGGDAETDVVIIGSGIGGEATPNITLN